MNQFFHVFKSWGLQKTLAAIALFGVVAVTHQNCAKTQFGSNDSASEQKQDFACNQPQTTCQSSGGATGTMTCQSTDHGPVWGPCDTTQNPPGNNTCTFNGVTYANGQSFVAYQLGHVPASGVCVSETRTCMNGTLSGSYQNMSCVNDSGTCTLGGQSIPQNGTITTYLTPTVPYGQTCQSQVRVCKDQMLSGSYTNLTCVVQPPANCSFNGQTIAHGGTVTAFQNPSVPFGSTCSSQVRTCNNGVLSGSYTNPACTVAPAANCSFNGQSIANGGTVTAYQNATVPFGSTCSSQVRTCNNGVLTGSFTNPACSVLPAANCSFNGQTIPSGGTVTAYQNATVPFGSTCSSQVRTCSNGVLSGSYTNPACSVQNAPTCVFNGQTINNGGSVTAYQNSMVPFGSTCSSEVRTCTNGMLSGSFTNPACAVQPPANCSFNGQTINNGGSVTAYQNSTVPYGATCMSQVRTCTNGTLSGAYTNAACTVQPPADCSFNGQTVANGQSIQAYLQATVVYGANCSSVQQTRTCSNGVLSGTAQYPSCNTLPPANCMFNGAPVLDGQSVPAYENSMVTKPATCNQQTRMCSNGNLSGSFMYPTCTQQDACTVSQVTKRMKIIFVVDQSGSNNTIPIYDSNGHITGYLPYGTDANKTTRLNALQKFLTSYRAKTNFQWQLVTFQGNSAKSYIKSAGLPKFSQSVTEMDTAINSFKTASDTGETPYKAAFNEVKSNIDNDPDRSNATNPSNYMVLFISDGLPTDFGQPPVFSGTAWETEARKLLTLAPGRMTFNIMYYGPQNSTAATQLQTMSAVLGGRFIDTNMPGYTYNVEDVANVPSPACGMTTP